MARTDFASVDDYIAAQSAPTRRALVRVRATLRKALPRATERISYQIPVFELDGVMVLYFAGFRGHYSIYPATPRLVRALARELSSHLHSKTIRFSLEEAVPVRLITRIAKLRAAEATELALAKAAKKKASKQAKSSSRGKLPKRGAKKR